MKLESLLGKRGILLLKGITALIFIYAVVLSLDMALPAKTIAEPILRKEPASNQDLRYIHHKYLIMTSGAKCEVDDSTLYELNPGDTIQYKISPWYKKIKQISYYSPANETIVTSKNMDDAVGAFPWFHSFVLALSLIVLLPKYTEVTSIMIPFFFVFISFIVFKIIMWS